jgi:hypothetical protein
MLGSSCVAAKLAASQEGLSSIKLKITQENFGAKRLDSSTVVDLKHI